MFINGNVVGIDTTTPDSAYAFHVNGTAAGTSWTNLSDARLKTQISPITEALILIQRLQGVRCQWRPVDQRSVGQDLSLPIGQPQIGFIAQEVKKVAPEAVTAPADGASGVYGAKEIGIVAVLVEAVKQQQTQINQLTAEVAALKAKN